MKKTIVIIGAAGNMGSAIAHSLAHAKYRILLMDRNSEKSQAVYNSIKILNPEADLEIVNCAYESSWEADIIIPAVWYQDQESVAQKIKEIVTGKIVLSISNPLNESFDGLLTSSDTSAAEELQKLLPHSKIVKAFNTTFAADFKEPQIGGIKVDSFIAGDDADAVTTIAEMVKDAGFNPLHVGNIKTSRTLEGMMLLLIGLSLKNDYKWHAGFKILHENA